MHTLLQKQTELLQERQNLAKEIEFLRTQLNNTPIKDTASRQIGSGGQMNPGELDLTPQSQSSLKGTRSDIRQYRETALT